MEEKTVGASDVDTMGRLDVDATGCLDVDATGVRYVKNFDAVMVGVV